MAAKKTNAETAVPQRKVPLEKLRRGCVKLFGITPSTFDGATAGLTGAYTVEEMKAMIDKWLTREVR